MATGRLQEEGKRGVTIPVPYTVYDEPEEEAMQEVIDQALQQVVEEDVAPEQPAEMDLTDIFDFGQDETPLPVSTIEATEEPVLEEPTEESEVVVAEPERFQKYM